MLAPFGWRSSATSVSSFDVPLTLSALVFGVLRPGFAADEVLLMFVPFL
jgi:hypothetical protein